MLGSRDAHADFSLLGSFADYSHVQAARLKRIPPFACYCCERGHKILIPFKIASPMNSILKRPFLTLEGTDNPWRAP